MKVVAFNGSPRKEGNTYIAINTVLKELEEKGINTEHVELRKHKIRGCIACMGCVKNQDKKCVIKDDINLMIEKMIEADGIIIGSPVYVSNMTSETKALIDRAGFVAKVNGDFLKNKVGAAVVALRRGGGCATFSSINYFFLISQMIVPGSIYWNFGLGLNPGDIANDDEGMKTFKTLGQNMAWLLEKINK